MNINNNFTMQEVENFWDSVADIYDKCNSDISGVHCQRFTESLKFLELKRNSKILNIWSRTGMAIPFLRMRESKLDITNAELSSGMIRLAKMRFSAEKFDKVNLLNLPYPDNYFDEILSLETIEHVSFPHIFLKELYRVLKTRGRLVLSAPPETAEFALKIYSFFFSHHGEDPHKFISSKKMKLLLKEVNFTLLVHKGTLLIPVNLKCVRDLGELIINIFQNTFISEFGIRHFYAAIKKLEIKDKTMVKKILLLYPPVINQVRNINISAFDKTIGCYPPLGLFYIATYLKTFSNYEVEILDCFAEKLDFEEIKAKIRTTKPDIVGISAMTHFWVDVVEISRIAKELFPNIKVVVGGPHATIYPISTVKNKYIDYAISGEAEFSFKKLLDAISDNWAEEDISKITGVATKLHLERGKTNADIEHQRIENLNEIPFPDHNLIDNRKYLSVFAKKGTFTTLMTSRGCPFNCIFCDRLGKEFRAVNADNVIKEIKGCIQLGITNFFLHDDTFTVDKERVKKICEAIKREHLVIKWEARARVDCIDYELLKQMKQAGLSRISFGVESGNEKILTNLRKDISLNRVREAFRWCRELRITTLADFMLGSPGENLEEIDDTLKLVKQIKPDYVQFSITCPYPATPLYKKLLSEGRIKTDVWLEFAENPDINFVPPIASEYFDRKKLEELVTRAYRRAYFNSSFIIKELKKIKSLKMLFSRIKYACYLMKG